MSFLSIKKVRKQADKQWILKDVSLKQYRFEKLAIVGETGSGKSTLLKVIAGLEQADSGEVTFDGVRVKGPDETLLPGHTGIAYLSQMFELPKFLRVSQVLDYANVLSESSATKIFKLCRIQHLLERKTDQLSGGEQHRVALARQLLTQPKLLLLDEPFSNIDSLQKSNLQSVLADVTQQLGITTILVSHDPLDVLSWAETILVLRRGKILQYGTPHDIYYEPSDEYVAGMLGKYNIVPKGFYKTLSGLNCATDVLVRPEQFKLTLSGRKGMKGKVLASRFYGTYYEVDVLVKKEIFCARLFTNQYLVGSEVVINL